MEFHVLNPSKLKLHLVHDHAPKLFDESSIIAQVEIMHWLQELPHLRYSSQWNYLRYDGIHTQMNYLV
jgi:hypothetical protein